MSVNGNENHHQTNGHSSQNHLDDEQYSADDYQNGVSSSSSIIMPTDNGVLKNSQENILANAKMHDGDTTKDDQLQTTTDTQRNHDGRDSRPKKFYGIKNKYSSISPNRPICYSNGNHYGPTPYYPYPVASTIDKPTPLMFIPPTSNTSAESTTIPLPISSASPASRDQTAPNSGGVSPQNLPPRLRKVSSNENDSTTTTTTTITGSNSNQASTNSTHTSGRRPRSILPRAYANFYAQHPPPPLMATPPGVLYPYPPSIQPGVSFGYNITPEDLEYYGYAPQYLGIPPAPFIWSSPSQSPMSGGMIPPFPIYPMSDIPSEYVMESSVMVQPGPSFLNPEATEWVPTHHDVDLEPEETKISLDNDVDFPPLNSAVSGTSSTVNCAKESIEENNQTIDTLKTADPKTSNAPENLPEEENNILPVSESRSDEVVSSVSSQEDSTSALNVSTISSSLSVKVTPISYSTVILQTSDNQKSNKTRNNQGPSQRQQVSNNQQTQSNVSKDRPNKVVQSQQQHQSNSSQNAKIQRRQSGKVNGNSGKTFVGSESNSSQKQQQQQQLTNTVDLSDEWIEVKSKKSKKFDRIVPESSSETGTFEDINSQTELVLSHPSSNEQLSLTVSSTSEDDLDEKDQVRMPVVLENDIYNEYNQMIINEIHTRLNLRECLLIIMRGCPGSGKSTLARSINNGYNGVILSADDFFTDPKTNQYNYDVNKLDEAHKFNQSRTSEALKRKVSPIIIDNTNTQIIEMRPYIAMANEANYKVVLAEPQTPWRYKARELAKRNRHYVPLKQIKEMLNRFEHEVNVQSIIDRLPKSKETNRKSSHSEPIKIQIENEPIDNQLGSKKVYEKVEDSSILDDVRCCVNDMILFLTSQFYQTALSSYTSILTNTTATSTTSSQSSTPLSVSYHDLSLLSPTSTSLPSTPTTPHTRFHRQMTRFSPTISQDHSYFTDHHLRLSSTLTRGFDPINSNNFTGLSAPSAILSKKRRKHKTKSPQNESTNNGILLNTNNNNNNMDEKEHTTTANDQSIKGTFDVYLAEECPDFLVIDESNENDWLGQVHRNLGIQINRNETNKIRLSKTSKPILETKNSDLINIIHQELNQPSSKKTTNDPVSFGNVAVQCTPDDLNSSLDDSDRILQGRCSAKSSLIESSVVLLAGFNECGVQVDLNESADDSLNILIKSYSNHLTVETIQQFFYVCHENLQWTRTQIEHHLKNRIVIVPTLRQLSLNALNKWNEQIKLINPTFDTHSLNDLLEDINDEEITDDFIRENSSNTIEFIDNNSIQLPWENVDSLQDLYGDVGDKSFFISNQTGIVLPIDDDLAFSIHQALQRYLMKISPKDFSLKPVNENQRKKMNKSKINHQATTNTQRWTFPSEISSTKNVPSLKQIMEEEQQAAKAQKSKTKYQLDYATEYKLKELERRYPSLDVDLIYDMFRENEFNYEITLVCICSMLDDDASLLSKPSTNSKSPIHSTSQSKVHVEPVMDCYETLRTDALRHAQRRKEYYTKAQQANRHGMAGVASYYIHQASEQTRLMKDANRAACERLSRWRLAQFRQTFKLDLHGLHQDEALELFKQVEQEMNEGNRRTTPKSIEIITGYGKNSIYAGGYGKIRSVVLNYIQQRNYKYSEPNRGTILLQFVSSKTY